jgi:hypothetical protein
MFSETVSKLLKPGGNDEKNTRSRSSSPAGTRTPVYDAIRHLKSYISAVTAFKNGRAFQVKPSIYRKRTLESVVDKEGLAGAGLTVGFVFKETKSMLI